MGRVQEMPKHVVFQTLLRVGTGDLAELHFLPRSERRQLPAANRDVAEIAVCLVRHIVFAVQAEQVEFDLAVGVSGPAFQREAVHQRDLRLFNQRPLKFGKIRRDRRLNHLCARHIAI